jgi:hypothetical protein
MTTLDKDWGFVRSAVPDLQEYLFSAQLYWPVSVTVPGQPKESASLTPGNLMLAVKRLNAAPWVHVQEEELEQLVNKVDYIRERWKANWRLKAGKEFSARLKLWESYMRDLMEDAEKNRQEYSHEVRWRAILQILSGEMQEVPPAEIELLKGLDQNLKIKTEAGPFIWEAETAKGFAREQFWFLYINFRKTDPGKPL